MRKIEPIRVEPGMSRENLINKIDESLKINGFAGLRVDDYSNTGLAFEDITELVGNGLGWVTRFNKSEFFRYEDDHSSIENLSVSGPETVIVPWHVSGIHGEYAHAGVFWKMEKFTAPNGSGKTGIFDCEKLMEIISPKWKELLLASKVAHVAGDFIEPRDAVSINPLTKRQTIRIRTDSDICEEKLSSVNGREPTDEERKAFRQISVWAFFNARSNATLQQYWDWQEGDILIVDLFRMAYSVFGGFSSGQRKIVGHWAFYE